MKTAFSHGPNLAESSKTLEPPFLLGSQSGKPGLPLRRRLFPFFALVFMPHSHDDGLQSDKLSIEFFKVVV
jgi:hypothetical protein